MRADQLCCCKLTVDQRQGFVGKDCSCKRVDCRVILKDECERRQIQTLFRCDRFYGFHDFPCGALVVDSQQEIYFQKRRQIERGGFCQKFFYFASIPLVHVVIKSIC